jgi:hypothetical protein
MEGNWQINPFDRVMIFLNTWTLESTLRYIVCETIHIHMGFIHVKLSINIM